MRALITKLRDSIYIRVVFRYLTLESLDGYRRPASQPHPTGMSKSTKSKRDYSLLHPHPHLQLLQSLAQEPIKPWGLETSGPKSNLPFVFLVVLTDVCSILLRPHNLTSLFCLPCLAFRVLWRFQLNSCISSYPFLLFPLPPPHHQQHHHHQLQSSPFPSALKEQNLLSELHLHSKTPNMDGTEQEISWDRTRLFLLWTVKEKGGRGKRGHGERGHLNPRLWEIGWILEVSSLFEEAFILSYSIEKLTKTLISRFSPPAVIYNPPRCPLLNSRDRWNFSQIWCSNNRDEQVAKRPAKASKRWLQGGYRRRLSSEWRAGSQFSRWFEVRRRRRISSFHSPLSTLMSGQSLSECYSWSLPAKDSTSDEERTGSAGRNRLAVSKSGRFCQRVQREEGFPVSVSVWDDKTFGKPWFANTWRKKGGDGRTGLSFAFLAWL